MPSPLRISDATTAAAPLPAGTLVEIALPNGSPPPDYLTRKSTLTALFDRISAPVSGSADSSGSIPASTTTAGWAITSNYDGLGGVELWSTVHADGSLGQGFRLNQKLTATTYSNLVAVYGDSTQVFFEVGPTSNGTPTGARVFVGADGTRGYNGTLANDSLILFTNGGGGYSLNNDPIALMSPILAGDEVTAKTSDYVVSGTIENLDCGRHFTNTGATGTVVFTMPNADIGWRNTFTVDAAQVLRILMPASHTINIGGTVSGAAGNAESSTVGASVTIVKIATNKYVAVACPDKTNWTIT